MGQEESESMRDDGRKSSSTQLRNLHQSPPISPLSHFSCHLIQHSPCKQSTDSLAPCGDCPGTRLSEIESMNPFLCNTRPTVRSIELHQLRVSIQRSHTGSSLRRDWAHVSRDSEGESALDRSHDCGVDLGLPLGIDDLETLDDGDDGDSHFGVYGCRMVGVHVEDYTQLIISTRSQDGEAWTHR